MNILVATFPVYQVFQGSVLMNLGISSLPFTFLEIEDTLNHVVMVHNYWERISLLRDTNKQRLREFWNTEDSFEVDINKLKINKFDIPIFVDKQYEREHYEYSKFTKPVNNVLETGYARTYSHLTSQPNNVWEIYDKKNGKFQVYSTLEQAKEVFVRQIFIGDDSVLSPSLFSTMIGQSFIKICPIKVDVNKFNETEFNDAHLSSSFMKSVTISEEIADFTGWEPEDLKSQDDVTNYIIQYIKENDLQNPENTSQIQLDKKLHKLLQWNTVLDGPLTYLALRQRDF
jgi:hypothetical protein